MAQGPIFPSSRYIGGVNSRVFPDYYQAATDTNGAGWDESLGLVPLTGADGYDTPVILRFPMPSLIPGGQMKLRQIAQADAAIGDVPYVISDGTCAMGSSPAAITLTAETLNTLSFTAADIYTEIKDDLSATPGPGDILVVVVTYKTSGNTVAVNSFWNHMIVWE